MKTHSKSKALSCPGAGDRDRHHWMQRAMDQHCIARPASAHPNGAQHRSLVSALASGQQATAADVAVIQNISAQASRNLNLIETLYNEYKANPSGTTLQRIENAISDLNQNLPALLQSAHIANATLSARITAAVNLILTTVNSFAVLMPQSSISASGLTSRKAPTPSLLHANDLKRQWNQQVCAPTGNTKLDAAFAGSVLR